MRALWIGTIRFGLIHVPVKLYGATKKTRALEFRLLHRTDNSPIRYRKFCIHEDREIPPEEIISGYEYKKNTFVTLTQDDFERIPTHRPGVIDILSFTTKEQVATKYYDRTFFLEPDTEGDRGYALLHAALQRTHAVAIGKYLFRNIEHLILIEPNDTILIAHHLRFQQEMVQTDDLKIPLQDTVSEREITMASELIQQLTQPFHAQQYHDTYTEGLLQVIEQKIQGKPLPKHVEKPQPTRPQELETMLEKSVQRERERAG